MITLIFLLSVNQHSSSTRKGRLCSFFPLKDPSGSVQLIVDNTDAFSDALSQVPVESVVLVQGSVLLRPSEARRDVRFNFVYSYSVFDSVQGPGGDIDIKVHSFLLLNPATQLPFVPSGHNLVRASSRAHLFPYQPLHSQTKTIACAIGI